MTETPSADHLRQAFGLRALSSASLTPWATVLRGQTTDELDVVVKVTATKPDRAEPMAAWTTALRDAGIPVVSPVSLRARNPQRVGDSWWVVYPFIQGRPYRGGESDAAAAGALLGRIHAAELPDGLTASLRQYEFPDSTLADAEGDLETLEGILPEKLGDHAMAAVRALLDRWWSNALPTLREEDAREPLPRAALSSDYRSTNIVFGSDGAVTLIDPDNGGFEPRLFELAMAVVLFHRESTDAPGRLFTQSEWEAFFSGYAEHVTLTERERKLWPHALDHMLWEEGTWALEDTDDDSWGSDRERGYLAELAVMTSDRFQLPE